MEQQIPVIYFLGVSPGRYQPVIPTFIVGWHPESPQVQLAFGVNLPLPFRELRGDRKKVEFGHWRFIAPIVHSEFDAQIGISKT